MMAVWDQFVLRGSSTQLLLQKEQEKKFAQACITWLRNTEFQALDLHPCCIEKVWIQLPWWDRTGPILPGIAGHLEHHQSTNPIYHQSFDPWLLLSVLIISVEVLRYRLISEPGAREVNHILLLLLLPANKRGVEQKSWEIEEEITGLFVMETDEEKTEGEGGCKATGMVVVLGARVGWSFAQRVCLNLFCLKVA